MDKMKPWQRLSKKQTGDPGSTDGDHDGLGKCMDGDCSKPASCRCTYVDRRQVKCGTTWCDEHSRIVLGLPYCRRHATVVRLDCVGFTVATVIFR